MIITVGYLQILGEYPDNEISAGSFEFRVPQTGNQTNLFPDNFLEKDVKQIKLIFVVFT